MTDIKRDELKTPRIVSRSSFQAELDALRVHPDERVFPLALDVTNASQIQRAVAEVGTLDVLINNAGIAIYDDLSNLGVLEQHFATENRSELALLRQDRHP